MGNLGLRIRSVVVVADGKHERRRGLGHVVRGLVAGFGSF